MCQKLEPDGHGDLVALARFARVFLSRLIVTGEKITFCGSDFAAFRASGGAALRRYGGVTASDFASLRPSDFAFDFAALRRYGLRFSRRPISRRYGVTASGFRGVRFRDRNCGPPISRRYGGAALRQLPPVGRPTGNFQLF